MSSWFVPRNLGPWNKVALNSYIHISSWMLYTQKLVLGWIYSIAQRRNSVRARAWGGYNRSLGVGTGYAWSAFIINRLRSNKMLIPIWHKSKHTLCLSRCNILYLKFHQTNLWVVRTWETGVTWELVLGERNLAGLRTGSGINLQEIHTQRYAFYSRWLIVHN